MKTDSHEFLTTFQFLIIIWSPPPGSRPDFNFGWCFSKGGAFLTLCEDGGLPPVLHIKGVEMAKSLSQAGVYVERSGTVLKVYRIGRKGLKGGRELLTEFDTSKGGQALKGALSNWAASEQNGSGREG